MGTQSGLTFAITWTIADLAPLPMGFSRQEHWSGLPFPSPGDLPSPGIEPRSPAMQADYLLSEPPGKPANFNTNWQLSSTSTHIKSWAATVADLQHPLKGAQGGEQE